MATKPTRCVRCKSLMTWAAQRVQFGRLTKNGYSPEIIKAITPRCQKCVTRFMKYDDGEAGAVGVK